LPAEQGVQEIKTADMYLPAAHAAHVEAPAIEYLPTPQVEHESRPESMAYVPAAQLVHEVMPTVLYFPEAHKAHALSPAVLMYLPATQSLQSSEASLPVALTTLPEAQFLHAVAPTSAE